MTHIIRLDRRGTAVFGLAVLLHLAAFWFVIRAKPARPPRPDPVQWIQGVTVAAPTLLQQQLPVRSAMQKPRYHKTPGTELDANAPGSGAGVMSAPIEPAAREAAAPVKAGPALPDAPSIDLSPEGLGRAIGRARAAGDLAPPRQWRGEAPEPFGRAAGPARLSETTGASGSRVTRVETGWGVYCIRTPPPGRAPVNGPGLEMALPTNCP